MIKSKNNDVLLSNKENFHSLPGDRIDSECAQQTRFGSNALLFLQRF